MKQFNKIFKQIILENKLQVNIQFPDKFSFSDYGLEFIFDIMPTFGEKYIWHTVEDLKNIPQLINTLKNTAVDILYEIADGFFDAANAEQEEYPDEEMQQPNNLREISEWIRTLANTDQFDTISENEDINPYNNTDVATPLPRVVKEVRPRAYRRGLKALSINNRRKFNQQHLNQINAMSQTDIKNKVKQPQILQQPISKSVITPAPGVDRPLGLNRTQKKLKNTFSNTVYQPSITQLTKQNAKKRCIAERAAMSKKTICNQNNNQLEFTTNYAQPVKPHIQQKPTIGTQLPIKKQLCVVCKEYVQPKKIKLESGQIINQCPKCGLRLTKNNY